jgi:ComF family protein
MMRFADLTRHWRQAERVLLPPACLLCKASVAASEGDSLICGLCRRRWQPVPSPTCSRCGSMVEGNEACTFCADWPSGLEQVESAVFLDEGARRTVHALKYRGWWRVAEPMAHAMRGLAPLRPGAVLVPIPLGSRRHRRRGYNQSERLAAALAALTGLRVNDRLVVRARETRSQTALTPEARRANIAGAFEAAAAAGEQSLVLVDDVFTTGATLLDAARALKQAGAAWVGAVTFGRAGMLGPDASGACIPARNETSGGSRHGHSGRDQWIRAYRAERGAGRPQDEHQRYRLRGGQRPHGREDAGAPAAL